MLLSSLVIGCKLSTNCSNDVYYTVLRCYRVCTYLCIIAVSPIKYIYMISIYIENNNNDNRAVGSPELPPGVM